MNCHKAVHSNKNIPRIATDIRIGTKWSAKDPENSMKDKEDWTKGLTENQRKKESVRRRLAGAEE